MTIVIFEKAKENAEALRRAGRKAIEAAKQGGASAYYQDGSLGDGIIEEMPNGERRLLRKIDGQYVAVEIFGPKD